MKLKILEITTLILIFISQSIWSQTAVDSSRIIKVLSFNIYHGETMKGNFDLDIIAKVILDTNPDLVALQEVDFKTNRAKKYDLVTELGLRTKMVSLFGKAMNFDGGEYGEGVLSKYTFLQTRNVPLPFSPSNEPRSALEVILELPSGDTIAFVGTHLDHLKDEKDRVAQVKKINKIFTSNKYPTILAGDLNAQPKSTPINLLEEEWTSSYNKENPTPTFPSDNPKIKIDYVMTYPKNKWKVLNTEVIQNSIASDHCAYLVTLELLNR